MPYFTRGDVSIYYETKGSGFPLLTLPPGGMNATIEWWGRSAFNPLEVFSSDFWVISMDARNAGRSSGPLDMDDPWGSYAEDQVGLMNHLGCERFNVLGCCIGCSLVLSLLRHKPERIAGAVLEQPIGIDDENREVLPKNLYGRWASDLVKRNPEIELEAAEAFGERMCTGEFVISVTRDFVKSVTHPVLVMPGNNLDHPRATGLEIASLLPNAEMVLDWRYPADIVPSTVARIRGFLQAHTPVPAVS